MKPKVLRKLLQGFPSREAGTALLSGVLLLAACRGRPPADLGAPTHGLPPCPSTPNCVSSDGGDGARWIPPLALAVSGAEAWPAAVQAVAELSGARIVQRTDTYVHAECRSAVFGLVDDLQLDLRPAEGIIAVRSASRVGHWDLGVNRRRVERLRRALVRQGVIR